MIPPGDTMRLVEGVGCWCRDASGPDAESLGICRFLAPVSAWLRSDLGWSSTATTLYLL